jgi:hypothetical protein
VLYILTVPSEGVQLDAIASKENAFRQESLSLFVTQCRSAVSVSVHNTVPRHTITVERQDSPDNTRTSTTDELRHVSVSHQPTRRNRLDTSKDLPVHQLAIVLCHQLHRTATTIDAPTSCYPEVGLVQGTPAKR